MRFLAKETYAQKSNVKLSVKDRKLIQLLIQNGRATVSELAKNVGVSKPAIVQKMNSLVKKNVLFNPHVLSNVNLPINRDFYIYHIKTQLGMNKKDVNKKLLSIDPLDVILWYSGNFDLILASSGKNPQDVVEDIENVIPIKRLRVQKVTGNWMRAPYLFKEVKDKTARFERLSPSVSELDEKIILSLEKNPRSSLVEIAHEIGSSAVTARKRLKGLIENGAILGFDYNVNWWAVNRDAVSISFVVKGRANTNNVIKNLLKVPQARNVWEFAHEWNVNAVFMVRDQAEVNGILESVGKKCSGILDSEIMVLTGIAGK